MNNAPRNAGEMDVELGATADTLPPSCTPNIMLTAFKGSAVTVSVSSLACALASKCGWAKLLAMYLGIEGERRGENRGERRGERRGEKRTLSGQNYEYENRVYTHLTHT